MKWLHILKKYKIQVLNKLKIKNELNGSFIVDLLYFLALLVGQNQLILSHTQQRRYNVELLEKVSEIRQLLYLNGLFDMSIIVTVQVNVSFVCLQFTELVDETVHIVLRVCVSMSRQKPRAVRCDAEYRKGKGWQSGHVRLIPGRGASERVPEVAGINRRAGASFDLSHAPLPALPRPNWSLYCFCRMSPWLRQDAVNGQPPADNSQLLSLN